MEIKIDRKWKKPTYTVGRLYVNNVFECNSIEDTDRGLKQNMPISKIKEVKIAALTAIPTGTYKIRMDIVSPKYALIPWYIKNCHGGKMPRIMDVPGYSGILIHPGNTAADSDGCPLVGINDVTGMVTNSKATFLKLYNKMWAAAERNEDIIITII